MSEARGHSMQSVSCEQYTASDCNAQSVPSQPLTGSFRHTGANNIKTRRGRICMIAEYVPNTATVLTRLDGVADPAGRHRTGRRHRLKQGTAATSLSDYYQRRRPHRLGHTAGRLTAWATTRIQRHSTTAATQQTTHFVLCVHFSTRRHYFIAYVQLYVHVTS